MTGINYSDIIPNNVNLDEDPRLQRALDKLSLPIKHNGHGLTRMARTAPTAFFASVAANAIGSAEITNGSIAAVDLAAGVIPTTLPPSGAAGGSSRSATRCGITCRSWRSSGCSWPARSAGW